MTEKSNQKNENDRPRGKSESTYYDQKPKMKDNGPSKIRQQFSKGMTYFLVIAASIIFYFSLFRIGKLSDLARSFAEVAKPVIYGLGIAFLLNPIVKTVENLLNPLLKKQFPRLKRYKKISRGTGIFLAIIILIAIIVALCNMLLPELYGSIRDMIYTVPQQVTEVLERINQMNASDSTLGNMMKTIVNEGWEYLATWMRTDLLSQTNIIMTNLTAGVLGIVKELFNLIVGVIISIYVLFSREQFSGQCKKVIYALFKPDHANIVLHVTKKANDIFGGFIIGKIIDSAIIGVLCFIILSLLNMPYTLLVSVIVGVTNVIPFFGPYIGAIPSTILIMLENPIQGVYFVIFIVILQQIDGNIIGPKILGDSTGLSAFWVVFAILVGGGLFGIIGMILGVPTFAVLYYIAGVFVNNRLERKKLPTDSHCYDQMSYVDESGKFMHSDLHIYDRTTETEENKKSEKGE